MKMKSCLVTILVALAASAPPILAAVIYTETWDATDAGWASGSGDLSVSYAGGFGDPGGSLLGSFSAQEFPDPQTGSFYADSGASGVSFTGDYWSDLGNFYGWTFQFLAADVLPSSLYMRFSDGANTYQANLLSQLGGVGSWSTLTTPALTYGLGGWVGPGGLSGLSNALANVQWVEVRLDRNQEAGQSYYLDNFEHNQDEDPPEPGGGVIPEPGTGILLLAVLAGRQLVRRRRVTS
ncbi:MAG TPA: PEP-CTERM sorting domain-containing protein [Kiritimatiellia bacterium]|nr:PEP-CTERM sorting domain-containing protein [Kiritimatiellia bacterium]HRZ13700.1 PEP-CTERM sorting domain-containing protein [Kiritimatiellia bacterium]HSA19392.1 PEP-CTERM sorting domain-containing protein [Kiritimatiellia bacterium]